MRFWLVDVELYNGWFFAAWLFEASAVIQYEFNKPVLSTSLTAQITEFFFTLPAFFKLIEFLKAFSFNAI